MKNAPPKGYWHIGIFAQTFTVKYHGQTHDLTTRIDHIVRAANGEVHETTGVLVP